MEKVRAEKQERGTIRSVNYLRGINEMIIFATAFNFFQPIAIKLPTMYEI
jgi:hypothetical protein